MVCRTVQTEGGTAIVCGPRSPRRKCFFCKTAWATQLCDHPITDDRLCDAPMCTGCATNVGPNRDLCPNHKGMNMMTDIQPALEAIAKNPDFRIIRRLEAPEVYDIPANIVDTDQKLIGAVVDVETTGLDASKDEIIELGIVKFEFCKSGWVSKVLGSKSWFQQPANPIPPHITEITGITDEMVEGHSINEGLIEKIMGECVIVIAMNSAFDREFLERRFSFAKEKPWACGMHEIDWKGHGAPALALQAVAWSQGFFFDAHRATTDCRALLHLLATIDPAKHRPYLAELLESARQPSYRVWANSSPFDMKDILKARGYRWADGVKTWFFDTRDQEQVAVEEAWLKERGVSQPSTRKHSAINRYSNRELII